MYLASFLFNMLGEEKKCMDFCSIRIYLERNKQTNKKWGNCYLSAFLRNKVTYSVSMTVIGFVQGDFFIIIIFIYLPVSGETGFLFHRASEHLCRRWRIQTFTTGSNHIPLHFFILVLLLVTSCYSNCDVTLAWDIDDLQMENEVKEYVICSIHVMLSFKNLNS